MSRPLSTLPVTLVGGAALEALEGAAVLVLALYTGIQAIVGKPHDMASAIGLAVFLLAAGGAMIFVGRGLWQGLSWGRTPAVLTQLFALIVGYYMVTSNQRPVGIPMIVAGVVALVLLLAPPTSRALFDEDEEDGEG